MRNIKKYLISIILTTMVVGGVSSYPIVKLNKETKKLEIKLENTKDELAKKNKKIKDFQTREQSKNKQIEKLEKENKKLKEDNQKLQQEKEELPTSKLEKTSNTNGRPQQFTLTFYSSLASENGGYNGTCTGEKLQEGMVASNVYPLGTKINIGGRIFTVADRGGSNFNSPNRLDVLVERNQGEDPQEYLNRVNNLGRKQVTGYILED